jgi:hypothetical protein
VKKLAITLAAAAALIAVLAPFEVPRTLFFGWMFFLGRVLPRVAPDWGTVAVSGTALVLFTAAVHWLGRSWSRQARPGQAWRVRWSLSLVAVVFLLFAAGVAVVGITHQVGWLLTSPEPLYGLGVEGGGWGASRNQLRQIGLAAHSYESASGSLPPGGTFGPDGSMGHSWETHLLPYIGYSTREIDMSRPWNDPKNEPAFRTVPEAFLNTELRTAPLVDGEGHGLSHYAANSRVLGANRGTRLQDITDGAANTLLIGEVNTGFRPWGHPVNWRDPANGINRAPSGFGGPPGAGGAQFTMADGSVRFINERVSPRVLQALSTPAGGEEIDGRDLGRPR